MSCAGPLRHERVTGLGTRDAVSVIPTRDRRVKEANVHQYLASSLVLHALMIHLDRACDDTALQTDPGEGLVSDNVFATEPREAGMIAAVLAGRLGQRDRLSVLNCFGPAYLHHTVDLISLEWLRTEPVRDTLRRVDDVPLPEEGARGRGPRTGPEDGARGWVGRKQRPWRRMADMRRRHGDRPGRTGRAASARRQP